MNTSAVSIINNVISNKDGCYLKNVNDKLSDILTSSGLTQKNIGISRTSVNDELSWSIWTVLDEKVAKQALNELAPPKITTFCSASNKLQ